MRYKPKQRPPYFTLNQWSPLAKGLVFAGLGRFTGSTYYHDSSLYASHGTLTNMDPATDWVRGIGRPALDFDGSNDFVRSNELIPPLTEFTIAGWNSYVSKTAANTMSISLGKAGGPYSGIYPNRGTTVQVYAYGNIVDSGVTTPTGMFHNAVARNTVTNTGYGWVNGVRFTADGTTTYSFPLYLYLAETATLGRYYGGTIADVMLWSRILSDSEMKSLADPSNVMYSLGGNPLLRYRPNRSRVYFSGGGAPPAAGHPASRRFGGVPYAAVRRGVW